MQIVIDIPEDVLKRTVFYREFRDLSDYVTTIKALEKAVPLPEGYGRLIDADVLISGIKDLKKSPWYKDNTNFAYLPRKEAVAIIEEIIIKDAPTIIEADKAESEDEYDTGKSK